MKYQYYSKWLQKWCDFKKTPGKFELGQMKKYFYKVRIINQPKN